MSKHSVDQPLVIATAAALAAATGLSASVFNPRGGGAAGVLDSSALNPSGFNASVLDASGSVVRQDRSEIVIAGGAGGAKLIAGASLASQDRDSEQGLGGVF